MTACCPKCVKDDAIQKVSSVYSNGVSSGSFSGPSGGIVNVGKEWGFVGGHTTLSGSSMSDLARLLAPPEQPKPPSSNGFGCLWVFPALLYIGFFVFLFSIPGLIVSGEKGPTVMVLGALIGGCIGVWQVGKQNEARIERDRLKDEEEKAKWDVAMLSWQTKKSLWDNAYYCFRDDIVFDPNSGFFKLSSQLDVFLAGPGPE
jgi:hypothetical protein